MKQEKQGMEENEEEEGEGQWENEQVGRAQGGWNSRTEQEPG